MKYQLTISLTILLLMTGCGSTDTARKLAEDVSSSTAGYEKQLAGKIAAENKFYTDQLRTLREQMAGDIDMDKIATASPQQRQALVQRTLLYGRIRLGADREGRLAAARLLDANGSPAVEVIDVVDKGVKESLQQTAEVRARQLALNIDRIAGLAKLNYAQNELGAVRRHLTMIVAGPNSAEALKAWVSFGQTLRATLNEKK